MSGKITLIILKLFLNSLIYNMNPFDFTFFDYNLPNPRKCLASLAASKQFDVLAHCRKFPHERESSPA